MIRFHSGRVQVAVLVIAALVALSGTAMADQQEGDGEKQIRVKKVMKQCEGDDCEGGKRIHKIMIDADGEIHEADGDDFTWVSDDGSKKVVVIKKCKGDDCADEQRIHKIMIGDDGEVHQMSGDDHVWISGGHGRHGNRFRFRTPHLGGGFLGVGLTELTNELRAHFGVPEDAGVMVASVVDDSPAAKAGLQAGDIITRVNGENVESGSGLARRIRKLDDGAVAGLEVWRDGKVETIDAAVEEHKAPEHVARAFAHNVSVDCDDEEDCNVFVHASDGLGDLCDGQDECEVKIECQGAGDCDCTVNGESADCEGLHKVHVGGD